MRCVRDFTTHPLPHDPRDHALLIITRKPCSSSHVQSQSSITTGPFFFGLRGHVDGRALEQAPDVGRALRSGTCSATFFGLSPTRGSRPSPGRSGRKLSARPTHGGPARARGNPGKPRAARRSGDPRRPGTSTISLTFDRSSRSASCRPSKRRRISGARTRDRLVLPSVEPRRPKTDRELNGICRCVKHRVIKGPARTFQTATARVCFSLYQLHDAHHLVVVPGVPGRGGRLDGSNRFLGALPGWSLGNPFYDGQSSG